MISPNHRRILVRQISEMDEALEDLHRKLEPHQELLAAAVREDVTLTLPWAILRLCVGLAHGTVTRRKCEDLLLAADMEDIE